MTLGSRLVAGVAAAGPAVDSEEVQRRIDAAVTEAQEEAEESMAGLLVCLGQEEAKVERCARSSGALQ